MSRGQSLQICSLKLLKGIKMETLERSSLRRKKCKRNSIDKFIVASPVSRAMQHNLFFFILVFTYIDGYTKFVFSATLLCHLELPDCNAHLLPNLYFSCFYSWHVFIFSPSLLYSSISILRIFMSIVEFTNVFYLHSTWPSLYSPILLNPSTKHLCTGGSQWIVFSYLMKKI